MTIEEMDRGVEARGLCVEVIGLDYNVYRYGQYQDRI